MWNCFNFFRIKVILFLCVSAEKRSFQNVCNVYLLWRHGLINQAHWKHSIKVELPVFCQDEKNCTVAFFFQFQEKSVGISECKNALFKKGGKGGTFLWIRNKSIHQEIKKQV